MHYAIIAAGEGSRLAQEGILQPKPLVEINGRPMLGRLLDLFLENNAESISVIINPEMPEVQVFVEQWKMLHPELDFRMAVKQTPSSMHSFAVLRDIMPEGRFCLTTVDTIFKDEEFCRYIKAFETMPEDDADGLFAVTSFVDDEKPLWVSTDTNGFISEFSDNKGSFVSGGIYGLNSNTAFLVLDLCMREGQSRMRNFQRALISSNLKIRAWEFDKIFDIDHASDIKKAEQWCC